MGTPPCYRPGEQMAPCLPASPCPEAGGRGGERRPPSAGQLGPRHGRLGPLSQPLVTRYLDNVIVIQHSENVKFAPCLSEPPAHPADTEQPPPAAPLPPPPAGHTAPPTTPDSKCEQVAGKDPAPPRPRRPRTSTRPPGVIRTGPLQGLRQRPRTDRRHALDLDQVRALVNAAAFAQAQGRPLVAGLTLTWRLMDGFAEQAWPAAQTRVFDHMSRWLRRREIVPAFAWIRERVPGRGAHTHLLLHLPRRGTAGLAEQLRGYLAGAFGFRDGATASGRAERGVAVSCGRFGAWTPKMRAGQLRYCLKGLDPTAFRYVGQAGETENIGAALGIEHRGPQGLIAVKRCGASQNIGPAARRRAGWTEVRDLAGLRRILHPAEAAAWTARR